MPRLPTPLGTFLYPRFLRLPWADRARYGKKRREREKGLLLAGLVND